MTLRSGFRSKAEEIEWRRAKIIELKSQGLDQREIAQVLQVTPALISYDVQCMRNEAKDNVRDYTTKELPLQFRVCVKATWNAIKQFWDISQKAEDNKEKMQALDHYLDSHIQLWMLLYGGQTLETRFINGDGFGNDNTRDHSHDKNGRQYEEGELVFPEGKSPYVYHSTEYI